MMKFEDFFFFLLTCQNRIFLKNWHFISVDNYNLTIIVKAEAQQLLQQLQLRNRNGTIGIILVSLLYS